MCKFYDCGLLPKLGIRVIYTYVHSVILYDTFFIVNAILGKNILTLLQVLKCRI